MSVDGDQEDIPDGLVFDESFVRSAAVRELTAEDRVRRARRIVEQEEERAAAEAHRKRAQRQERRRRRPHRRLWAALRAPGALKKLVLVGALLGAVVWLSTDGDGDEVAEPERWESSTPSAGALDVGAPRPTPADNPVTTPLGEPPARPREGGPYRFVATQPGTSAPVTYDPCREIVVVVNDRARPGGGEGLVEEALRLTSAATGLRFRVEGPTDEPPSDDRADLQPTRYGDRWAPVLVAWTDPAEYPEVAGDVAGRAGSTWVATEQGSLVYVTGSVMLDGPDFDEILSVDEGGREAALGIILHELGHLVGLDHVEDDGQLMWPEGSWDVSTFRAGDLRGLYELGSGVCVPRL